MFKWSNINNSLKNQVHKLNSNCFDLVTSVIIIIKIYCTDITFPWGTKQLHFYIILQICVTLIIFAGPEYILVIISSWSDSIIYSLDISRLLGVGQVALKGSLVSIDRYLFCLLIFCTRTIPLDMVSE